MTTPKSVALSILLAIATTAVSVASAELAWRWLKGVPPLSRDNLVQQALDLVRANTGLMVHDPLVGWRLKDEVHLGQAGFTTGRRGVRMNQTEIRPLRRGGILAVGDSFTAGSGVRDEEAWPARLEQLVGEPVTNGAAGAYGVDQIVLRAEQLAPEVEPRIVIIGILSQDVLRNTYAVYGGGYKPYFTIESGGLALQGVPVPRIDAAPLAVGGLRSLLGHSHLADAALRALGLREWWIDNRLRYKKVHPDEAGVAISCLLMDRLAAWKRDKGLRIIVVMMYGAGEIETSPPPWFAPPVVACAKERGLEALDTYDLFRAVLARDRPGFVALWLNEGGQLGHLSARGNRFVAEILHRAFFLPGANRAEN